jgi:hypothetical protein
MYKQPDKVANDAMRLKLAGGVGFHTVEITTDLSWNPMYVSFSKLANFLRWDCDVFIALANETLLCVHFVC